MANNNPEAISFYREIAFLKAMLKLIVNYVDWSGRRETPAGVRAWDVKFTKGQNELGNVFVKIKLLKPNLSKEVN